MATRISSILRKAEINEFLEAAIRDGVTPGAILLVEREGKEIFRGVYGDAALFPSSRGLDFETIFDVASLTKVIATTTAVMILWERKLIELTDPVKKFIPAFTGGAKESVTIEQLLSHSSGLPAWIALYQSIQEEEKRRQEPLVGMAKGKKVGIELAARAELTDRPGAVQCYSDLGFILLGAIVENVSGQDLDRFCATEIFKKLGMEQTFFNHLDQSAVYDTLRSHSSTTVRIKKFFGKLRFASTEDCPWRRKILNGEVDDDNAYAMGGVAGHAGLFSKADDIRKFARMAIRCYAHEEESVVMTSTLKRFLKKQASNAAGSFALGWDTPSKENSQAGKCFSDETFGHLGFTGCSLWCDMKRKGFVLLLTNRVHPTRDNDKIKVMRPALHDMIFEKGLL